MRREEHLSKTVALFLDGSQRSFVEFYERQQRGKSSPKFHDVNHFFRISKSLDDRNDIADKIAIFSQNNSDKSAKFCSFFKPQAFFSLVLENPLYKVDYRHVLSGNRLRRPCASRSCSRP